MKVLLVDDEPLIIEGIEKLLNKIENIHLRIFKTTSSIEALEILKKVSIDILVTDIRMPNIDGLVLAKKARNIREQLKIIFVSSYDDFSYLKEAIVIGSSNYILKPIDPSELTATFGKLAKEINERRLSENLKGTGQTDIFRDNLLRKLLRQNLSQEEFEKWHEILHPIAGWPNYSIIYLEGAFYDNQLLDHVVECLSSLFVNHYSLLMEPNKFVILFSPQKEQHYRQSVQYLSEHFDLFAVIGIDSQSLLEVSRSYRSIEPFTEARGFLEKYEVIDLFQKTNLIIEYNIEQEIFFKSIELLEKQKVDEFQKTATLCIDHWSGHPFQPMVFKYLLVAIHKGLITLEKKEPSFQEIRTQLTELQNGDKIEFKEKLFHLCSHLMQKINETSNSYSPVIYQILNLLKKDFTIRHSLKSLADQFHMNPAYLGQLFLKELNMSFSEYDKKMRMKEANQRIKKSTERIIVIAKELGYEDISLFYRHYKKEYGVTPNKARKIVT